MKKEIPEAQDPEAKEEDLSAVLAALLDEDMEAVLAGLLSEDLGDLLAPWIDNDAMEAALADLLQEFQEDATP